MRLTAIIASLGLIPSLAVASPSEVLRELQPMHSPRAGHTSTTLIDDRVLIVGGFTSEEDRIAGVELFDPQRGRFETIDNATTPRQSHTATLLPDGRVLIAGGYGANTGALPTLEVFDPATRRFSPAGRMQAPRANHTAVALDDGRIALIGGRSVDWSTLDTIELYDPKTGALTQSGRLSTPRSGHIAVRLRDGRVFVAGGGMGRREILRVHTGTEIFDPTTGRTTPAAAMQVNRHDGVVLADGRVLVTGGSIDGGPRGRYDTAEVYDPTRNTFTPTAKMHRARYKHGSSSVLLPDGTVLIAGGAPQAELYDPATNTFSLIASESPLHGSFSSITLLRDSHALITGGYTRPDAPSSGAWIYPLGVAKSKQ